MTGRAIRPAHLNKRFKELVGRDVPDFAKTHILDHIHPDDRKPLVDGAIAAFAKGCDVIYDARILCGDGEYRQFHVVGRRAGDDGKRTSVYATFTPITDEEKAMREMFPVALKSMMSSSSDFSFVKDKNFKYITCSKSFAKLLGYKSEKSLIGKTDYDIIDKEYADRYRKGDVELIDGTHSRLAFSDELARRDGSPIFIDYRKYPLYDSSGSVIGILCMGRDVTETRKVNENLKLMTDNISCGLATYIVTPTGAKIAYFNEGLCALLGFTREEYEKAAGADAMSRVFEEDKPTIIKFIKTILSGAKLGEPLEYIYRVHVNGGGAKWVDHRAIPTERRGDTVVVNSVLYDITKQKETEEKLRMSEEQYRLAMAHNGNYICRYDVADKSVNMSPDVAAEFSMPERVTNVPYAPVKSGSIAPESAEDYIKFYEGILRGGKTGAASFKAKTVRGWRWLRARYTTVFSDDGKPVSAVVSMTDETELHEKEAESKAAREKERIFRMVAQHSNRSVHRYDIPTRTQYAEASGLNKPRMPKVIENLPESLIEKGDILPESAEDARKFFRDIHSGKSEGEATLHIRVNEDESIWADVRYSIIEYDADGELPVTAAISYKDITNELLAMRKVQEKADTDGMTGVLNREAALDAIERRLMGEANGEKCLLLIADIDDLKTINDTLGHPGGDKAICLLADTLKGHFRRTDIIGRIGGDEFIVFIENIESDERRHKIVGSLMKKLAGAWLDDDKKFPLRASVGVVAGEAGKDTFKALYKKADIALYSVKRKDKNDFAFYEPKMG
ncbi:MAG: diguanylate cyclase [Synergistaceae bacterium]|nr:diguanylate cyclase [Synergistaceae bacterium]